MWAPADLETTRKLVARILQALERGENVVVRCWGGLGRAGTIAASCLVARGSSGAAAIAFVRAARHGAVQTAAQEQFAGELADVQSLTGTSRKRR